ncbi:hypothetical protein BDF14DRAFT_1733395, partial [Spinellus fusiger]
VLFALVVGLITLAQEHSLDQAHECFILISNADSSRNTQFVRKPMLVFSHLQTQSCCSSIFADLFLSIE